jgi:endonuclease YncB( thermonuclease family)
MAVWRWPMSRIHNVVDGDTFDSNLSKVIDIGFSITSEITLPARLRINRINAARSNSTKGKQAKLRVTQLTANVIVDITTVKTYKYGGPDDKVGEYMAEVVLPDGSNLSDLLVSEGLAVYWDGEGPRPADE